MDYCADLELQFSVMHLAQEQGGDQNRDSRAFHYMLE